MKKLFVLVADGGDGSYHTQYTFNEQWIVEQQRKYDEGEYDEWSPGIDGDGFHYSVLMVPDECTLQSLGISDCAKTK
jgi:hypothetical protein